MSKASGKASAEMRAEYRLEYSEAKPNRFATRMAQDSVVVVLDPDVASVFKSSESVNDLLRSVISALPAKPAPKKRRAS